MYNSVILLLVLYRCETWSLTLREEHRLRVSENRVLRRIFGPKSDEVTGGWRKLHNEELRNLYSSPSIIRMLTLVDGPPSSGAANPLLVPSGVSGTAAAITKSQHYASSSRAASDRDRPVTPASSPGGMSGGGSGGAVDGCGGHCVAFENFCYYCLQVVFIAGILTGVSLTIAGGVLRRQSRGGDLLVLVYIGCMIAMVCTVLLSVQCCVRRNVKRRKRALRAAREQRNAAVSASNRRSNPAHADMIPLQDLAPNTAQQQRGPQQQQYQPLLLRLVQQQATTVDNQRHSGNMGPPPYHHHQASFR
ncbi:hypothetical protein B7P43_G04722 [Cryptotermes secundus]|uniref:Uncharacterized protein n=1 Tax=Cryptotermes secundus TaxID=105785 RepID=A0A2J7PKP5_9NEOP|nr:hypothetical protein B7P43_G04722 [Cryptotermes secundus]